MKFTSESVFVTICLGGALYFAAGAAASIREKTERSRKEAAVPLNVSINAILREDALAAGKANAPFKLIEFADYQCPPCRGTVRAIESLLKEHGGRVALYQRQLPLTQLHPRAFDSATAAIAAGWQGKLASMHQMLMKGDLSEESIRDYGTSLGLDMASFRKDRLKAKKVLNEDIREAQMVGITGTPSFVVVTPDKSVFRLRSLEDISLFLN
jgi:protein-disulfide isomerase